MQFLKMPNLFSKSKSILGGWPAKVLLFLILLYGGMRIALDANQYPEKLIWSDMEGYYVYLPATFVYGGFDKVVVRDTNYLRHWKDTKFIYSKYTSGVAILEAPFFLSAHALAPGLDYARDGHSAIYCYALLLGAVVYMLWGMWLLWLTLRRYFPAWITLLVLAGLLFGTNLYYYSFFQSAMSHVYSFFLFACAIWFTDNCVRGVQENWKTRSKYFNIIGLGLVLSLVILVRPTNIVIVFYPIYRWIKEIEDKKAFWRSHALPLAAMLLCAFVVWIPQMMYWKTITGSWFIWSYEGESFKFWKEPKLFRVLFDAWNGWILYSPIVIFPLIALVRGRHSNRYSERILMVIFAIATYLFASWWAWWFGGAFGHRSYVEYLALLAIPFASLLNEARRVKWLLVLLLLVYGVFIYYSLGMTYLYQAPWDGGNWTYDSVLDQVKKLF